MNESNKSRIFVCLSDGDAVRIFSLDVARSMNDICARCNFKWLWISFGGINL